jgi:hypothetical protein
LENYKRLHEEIVRIADREFRKMFEGRSTREK